MATTESRRAAELSVVEIDDAGARFPEIVKRVADGERIDVMRGGKVIARLRPPQQPGVSTPEEQQAAWERLLSERARSALPRMTVDEAVALVREGRGR